MGLMDFFRNKQKKIDELDVLYLLREGIPFHVVLPGLKTVRTGPSVSTSYSQDGIRQTVHHAAPTQKVPNSINAFVKLTETQIIIKHAQPSGRHIFINLNNIHSASKIDKAFGIELVDGRSYYFGIDNKNVMKAYNREGINPQFVLNVFYNLITGVYERQYQQLMNQRNKR